MSLYSILLMFQVLVSLALIALVLIQHGKGADMGAAFGSGASGTVFGARGSASFLTRTTAALATVFFLNSLGLAYLVTSAVDRSSVLERVQPILPPVAPLDLEAPRPGPADVPTVPR